MSASRVTRPTQPSGKEVSFLRSGSSIYELVLSGDKLEFVSRGNDAFAYAGSAEGFTPLTWLQGLAAGGTLLLPARIEDYENPDSLAQVIKTHIRTYFDCTREFEAVAVLFVMMTWLTEVFHAVPYLRFLGLSGTGKSRGSDVIGSVCYRKMGVAGAATSAPLFRMIESVGGTLVIDEADYSNTGIGTDIAKILNCGFQKGSPVLRMEKTTGDKMEPRAFEVYGPKIINGRKRFQDDATESRCLTLVPYETQRKDIPVQLSQVFHSGAQSLRNKLLKFRFDYLGTLQVPDQNLEGLSRRTNQIILPLLVIADMLRDTSFKSDLLAFARDMEAQHRRDRGETMEAVLVQAYITLSKSSPTCGDVCDRMRDDLGPNDAEVRNITARKVSDLARGLGFTTRKTNRGAVLEIDKKRLEGHAERFSIVTTPSLATSLSRDGGDGTVTKDLHA